MNGNKGVIAGAIIGLATATTSLAIAFGVHLSTAERDAIIAETTALIAIAPLVGVAYDHSHRQSKARIEAAQTIAQKP